MAAILPGRRLVFGLPAIIPAFIFRNLRWESSKVPVFPVGTVVCKAAVHAWDAPVVQKYAAEVLRLSSGDCAVLDRMGITGASLLALGASKFQFLRRSGMTTGGALTLTQAIEDLRGGFALYALCVSVRCGMRYFSLFCPEAGTNVVTNVVTKSVLADFQEDGNLSTVGFSGSNDFEKFLSFQGVAGLQKVGGSTVVRKFEDIVAGATYIVVAACTTLKGVLAKLQTSVASAEKAVIDSVSCGCGNTWNT